MGIIIDLIIIFCIIIIVVTFLPQFPKELAYLPALWILALAMSMAFEQIKNDI